MFLHEEYIKRNKLDAPIVCYSQRTTLFLRNKMGWQILDIVWRPDLRHPGFFEFKFCKPLRNGWLKKKTMTIPVQKTMRCFWDEYEDKLILIKKLFKRKRLHPAIGREKLLAIWDIFLIAYESFLESKMSDEFFALTKLIRNQNLDISERMRCFKAASSELNNTIELANAFYYEFMPYLNNSSDWLAKILVAD